MRKLKIFLFLLYINAQAKNLNLPDVDLRTHFGPPHNQSKIRCFAYTTADLISEKIDLEVSALDISFNMIFSDTSFFKKQKNDRLKKFIRSNKNIFKDIDHAREIPDGQAASFYSGSNIFKGLELGGFEAAAIFLANAKDICPESQMPSSDIKIDELVDLSKAQFESINKHPSLSEKLGAEFSFIKLVNSTDVEAKALISIFQNNLNYMCHRIKINTQLIPKFIEIAGDLDDFKSELTKNPLKLKLNQKKLINVINYVLTQKNQSLAIGISARSLRIRNDYELSLSYEDFLYAGEHSVLVVGRKFENNENYFLIRNSWGESCDGYIQKIKRNCENGYFWISEDDLLSTLYSVVYLE